MTLGRYGLFALRVRLRVSFLHLTWHICYVGEYQKGKVGPRLLYNNLVAVHASMRLSAGGSMIVCLEYLGLYYRLDLLIAGLIMIPQNLKVLGHAIAVMLGAMSNM